MPDGFIPQGSEFQVNTETTSSQFAPSIIGLADGGYVMTWASKEQDGDYIGVYGQRYDTDGATVGGEFQVNTETIDIQSEPSITALADGGFVVTWQSNNQDGSGRGVFGQRYDAASAIVGGEFQVNTETTSNQFITAITGLTDGGFVVTWVSNGQDGSLFGIFGQRYDADGETIGDEFQVNTETANTQFQPSVAALADGGFVVTWESIGQDGDDTGIYAQQFAAQYFGNDENEEIIGSAVDNWIYGRDGDDSLNGKKGADTLYGDDGSDMLKGAKGKDMLYGGAGDDILKGSKGQDILEGGAGDDELFGGKGADVFVFAPDEGLDIIRDFKNGKDKIDLSGFDFLLKATAMSHFIEIGSAKNDVVGFEYEGTAIKIYGLDLGDINGADIII